MALQDENTIPETDVADADTYIPPRSSAFRTSKYPGFWSPGATIGNDPNPVSGDNPVAALSPGETGVPITPPPDQSQSESSFRTVQPLSTDPGESADARAAQFESDARATGYDTNPNDALKAANIASGVLGGGTGLLGLGIGEAATALGANPSDAIYGGGSSFDMTGNINQRLGYGDAFNAGLDDAHRQGFRGPQAAQRALQHANDVLSGGAGHWGEAGATQPRDTVSTTPNPQDVTAANRATGFAPSTPTVNPGFQAALSPATREAGSPTAPNPGAGTGNTVGDLGAPASAPATTGTSVPAGVGHPSVGGGKGGASSPSGGGQGSGGWGGRGATEPRDPSGFARGGIVINHYAAGGEVTAPPQTSQISHFDAGDVAQDAPPVNVASPQPAQSAMPSPSMPAAASQQYNPPPASVDTGGQVDGVQAALTPGEMVIKRDAAQVYSPEVLQLLNENPDLVESVLEALVSGLDQTGGQGDGADMSADDYAAIASGTSDDNSGLGVAAPTSRFPVAKKDPRNLQA